MSRIVNLSDNRSDQVTTTTLVVADDPLWSRRWDYSLEGELLARAGAELVVPEDQQANESLLTTADVVLSGGRRLDAALIATMHRCVGLVTYSVGFDGVDLDAAAVAGIEVRNVPGYCTDEVSDHAVLLMLAALRRLPHWLDTTSTGGWLQLEDQRTVRRLSGLTVGVVGAGRIGKAVARKSRAFGMATIAHDPFSAATDDDLPLVSRSELLARSDVLMLCASATSSSPFRLVASDFDLLGTTAPVIVNVARGSLVDERALADALRSGTVWAAALDVRSTEPPDPTDDPLAGAPNLMLTPHVAASSAAAIDDLRVGVAEAAIELLVAAGRLPGCAP
jgi:D-3-phosphoglycerate dehydrogenase